MHFSTTLMVLVPILSSIVSPAAGRPYLMQNLAVNLVMEDFAMRALAADSQGGGMTQLGGPIVSAPYDPASVHSQSWRLAPVGQDEIRFINLRGKEEDGFRVGAHVDGLEGKGLNAQKPGFGSAVTHVRPYGDGTEVYSFIFPSAEPSLAITSSKDANKPLALEVHNKTNALPHWVFYGLSEPGAVAPATLQELETVGLEEVLAGSADI